MEIVTSKDICILCREVLRLMDKRLVDHGARVGYILYRMLQCKGGYEDFELAEYALLGTLHDIGAYKVEKSTDFLNFETKDYMPHSIYGSLFLKYISPLADRSKIIMYSHIDYSQMESIKYEDRDIANFINFAGRLDLYNNSLGARFDYSKMRVYAGTKFSMQCFDLFDQAQVKYDIFKKLRSGEYKTDTDSLFDAIIFSDDEKQKYIEMLMYISGFRDEYNVINTVTSTLIAEEIAKKLGTLSNDEMSSLYFASILHDVGMLTVPLEIIDAPRRLTDDEFEKMRSHVEVAEVLLKGRVNDAVTDIAVRHHERGDGSGYPHHIVNQDMNTATRILQVADTVTGLTCKRSYHDPKPKSAVISILNDEVNHNRFHRGVVMAFTNNYDTIMEKVSAKSQEVLATWNKLNNQYYQVTGTLSRQIT